MSGVRRAAVLPRLAKASAAERIRAILAAGRVGFCFAGRQCFECGAYGGAFVVTA